MKPRLRLSALLIASLSPLTSEQVPVRRLEGRIHGFLVLRDQSGAILASGSLIQLSAGGRVTGELSFHFKDGSLYEETAVFSQQKVFRLLTYRLVHKGPAFKRPVEMSLDTASGEVTADYQDGGKRKTLSERLTLPADLANGMVTTLLGDIDPKEPKTVLSMLVLTPKPRIVKLEISPAGEDSFSVGGMPARALRYVVKVEIGGFLGLIAPLFGKQPPDTHIWMAGGKAPGFLKSEGPLYAGGPVWRIEIASPVWPNSSPPAKK